MPFLGTPNPHSPKFWGPCNHLFSFWGRDTAQPVPGGQYKEQGCLAGGSEQARTCGLEVWRPEPEEPEVRLANITP